MNVEFERVKMPWLVVIIEKGRESQVKRMVNSKYKKFQYISASNRSHPQGMKKEIQKREGHGHGEDSKIFQTFKLAQTCM